MIQTNPTNYTSGLFSIQDGSAGTGLGYQPTGVTPEPSSLVLLGTGLQRRRWTSSQAIQCLNPHSQKPSPIRARASSDC